MAIEKDNRAVAERDSAVSNARCPAQTGFHSVSLIVDALISDYKTQRLGEVSGTPVLPASGSSLDSPMTLEWYHALSNSLLDGMSAMKRFKVLWEMPNASNMALTSLARRADGSKKPHRFSLSRAEHSMDAGHLALVWSLYHGQSIRETVVAMQVGLLHDVRQRMRSHAGENSLRRRGLPNSNHDWHAAIEASSAEYAEYLECVNDTIKQQMKKLGMAYDPETCQVSQKDVVAAILGAAVLKPGNISAFVAMRKELDSLGLQNDFALDLNSEEDQDRLRKWNHIHLLVQDDVDMWAYMPQDISNTDLPEGRKQKAVEIIVQMMRSTKMEMVSGRPVRATTDPEAVRKFIAIYAHYMQDRGVSQLAQIVEEYAHRADERAGLSCREIIEGSDADAENGWRSGTGWKRKDSEILASGLDRHCSFMGELVPAFKVHDESEDSRYPIEDSDALYLLTKIREVVEDLKGQGVLPADANYITGRTPPIAKDWERVVMGEESRAAEALIGPERDQSDERVLNKPDYDNDFVRMTLRLSRVIARGGDTNGAGGHIVAKFDARVRQGCVIAVEDIDRNKRYVGRCTLSEMVEDLQRNLRGQADALRPAIEKMLALTKIPSAKEDIRFGDYLKWVDLPPVLPISEFEEFDRAS